MASYLTPDWLMQDIGQLLKTTRAGAEEGYGNALTQEEFESQYQTGHVNPEGGGRTRYYYDYDFGDIDVGKYHGRNVTGETDYSVMGQTIGDPEGYKFHSDERDKAYQYYLDSLEQRTGAGVGGLGPAQEANIWDPASFVGGIERAIGGTPGTEDPKSYTAFTPEMFKKLRTEYYQPELEEKRGSLIDQLIGKQRKARAIGGGFAGYGGREAASQAVETGYRGGVEDIYTGIEQKKAAGLQSIYDVLSQYEAIGEPV